MKKFYLFWLAALALFGISFQAKAEEPLKVTFTWETPGSVAIYVGSTAESAKADIPADATSYTATIDNTWGSCYVKATDGFYLETVKKADGSVAVNPSNTGGRKANVNMKTYNGQTLSVVLKKLNYSATLNANVINGAKQISAFFDATGREIKFKTGQQQIAFDPEIEKTISVTYLATPNTPANPYLKKDGTDILENFYGTYRKNNLEIANGTNLEFKVSDTPDPVEENVTLTATFDANAKTALSGVRDVTDNEYVTIPDNGSFQFIKGHKLRVNFTNADYIVSGKIGDTDWTPLADHTSGSEYTSFETVVEDAINISFTSTQREYENANVYVAIKGDVSGVILHNGSIDGPAVDLSALTPATYEQNYKLYTVSVSRKSPKLFIDAATGWHLTESAYYEPVVSEGSHWGPTATVTTENSSLAHPVRITTHKISRDRKLHVYIDGGADKFRLRDHASQNKELREGYWEIDYDPAVDVPFTITTFQETGKPEPVVTFNGVKQTPDENMSVTITPTEESIVKLHGAGEPAKIAAFIAEENASATVKYDKVLTHTGKLSDFKGHVGMEVTITPGEKTRLTDSFGAPIGLTDGSYTYTVTQNPSVRIVAEKPAVKVNFTPAANTAAESLKEIVLTFPEATTVTRTEKGNDEVIFQMGNFWAAITIDIEKVAGAEHPSFKITFTPEPTRLGNYSLLIPEGFFTIDGAASAQIDAQFELKKTITDLQYTFSPTKLTTNDWPNIAVVFDESYSVRIADAAKIAGTWDGTNIEGMRNSCENNMLLIELPESYKGNAGTFVLDIAAGALTVSGTPSPAIQNTWVIATPKEYIYTIVPAGTADVKEIAEITISFTNAESAVLNSDYYAMPTLKNTNIGYFQSGEIAKVENADKPTFKITFATKATQAGVYKFECPSGRFVMDGEDWSPAIEIDYTVNPQSGVGEILGDNCESADVFTIDGRIVVRNADREALESLEPGLYIVNGRKFIKK